MIKDWEKWKAMFSPLSGSRFANKEKSTWHLTILLGVIKQHKTQAHKKWTVWLRITM